MPVPAVFSIPHRCTDNCKKKLNSNINFKCAFKHTIHPQYGSAMI